MSTSALNNIESEFARLTPEAQLNLLERLVHRTRMAVTNQRGNWDGALSAMASDPEIQQEIRQINAEFRTTEGDQLGSE